MIVVVFVQAVTKSIGKLALDKLPSLILITQEGIGIERH
jgi:hypothetical protein